MVVTETGISTDDDPSASSSSTRRSPACASCLRDGIDVRGIFYWTLLDNFEWVTRLLAAVRRRRRATARRSSDARSPRRSHLGAIARRVASLARAREGSLGRLVDARARSISVVAWSKTHAGQEAHPLHVGVGDLDVVSQGLIIIFFGITKWMGVVEATVVGELPRDDPRVQPEPPMDVGQDRQEPHDEGGGPVLGDVRARHRGLVLLAPSPPSASSTARTSCTTATRSTTCSATLIVMAANFIAFAIFWVLKLLVFNRIFHVPTELDEVEEHLEHEEEIDRARPRGQRRQSLKFTYCSGTPRSASRHAAMTAWRSSRFLPLTRTWSPWTDDDTPFSPSSFTSLLMRLADVLRDPGLQLHVLSRRALRRLLDLLGVERLERDLAAHELLLEHLVERLQAVLGRRGEHELFVAELDVRVGVLEVEPRRGLAVRLVDGVADLLEVELGDDVEGRHARIVDAAASPEPRARAQ